jgi:uncharacterized delta-60 repeat protein
LGPVNCFAGQSDGKILVAAPILSPDGQFTAYLARFWPDGSRDTNFNALANGPVNAVAVQADGQIIVGGEFDWLGGATHQYGLGRLNPDGYPDTAFAPEVPAYSGTYAVALQADGKILFGSETNAGVQLSASVARLQNTGPATESLSWNGAAFTWLRGGTAPELWRTSFQSSSNGTDWVELGSGTRISGGWSSPALPAAPSGMVRARGWVSSGQYGCPSWFVESILQAPPPRPTIIVNDGKFGFRSNKFGFSYTAPSNRTVVVQGAPDLLNWKSLFTNVTGATPSYFSDPESATLPKRNYRLFLQP